MPAAEPAVSQDEQRATGARGKSRVLICGGGVIGASVAYFLSRRGVRVTVIERTGVACAASGKSGGFLAADWCDGTPLEALARRSFALHEKLARDLDGDWGYRRLTTFAGIAGELRRARGGADGIGGGGGAAGWVSDDVVIAQRLGTPETTAQVHPARFTAALMRAAEAEGAELRAGEVTGVLLDEDEGGGGGSRVAGVTVDGEWLAGDAVVIAMGPWSALARAWLPLPAVYGLKGHSLVFDTGTSVPAEALFLDYREAGGEVLTPEVFPRGDGTTYVCAVSSDAPLPHDPALVAPDPGALDRLRDMCRRLAPALRDSPVLAGQACYRPVTRDGLPLIGPVAGVAGAYVATGHSVWGILNAPGTGEALAELITTGATSAVDLSPFDTCR